MGQFKASVIFNILVVWIVFLDDVSWSLRPQIQASRALVVHPRDSVVGEHQQALEEFNKVALPQEDFGDKWWEHARSRGHIEDCIAFEWFLVISWVSLLDPEQ